MADNISAAVTLRLVSPDDEGFLCRVYGGTREEELALVPWTDEQREAFVQFQFAAQQQHYQSEYPQAEHQIILFANEPVGRVYVDRRAAEIRILDLALLPAHRGRGIGTVLLSQLMAEAQDAGKPLTIYIESFNRARQLFMRLGFKPVSEVGMHQLFEWQPAP